MSAPWWQQTTAAALLGTERREPPALPHDLGVTARPDSTPETALLDAAALGGALLRAALPARPAGDLPEPAAPDATPLAPPAAVQLLGLLVSQPPVAARLRPLALERWLRVAADRGVRVPARALPRLLALVTQQAELRAATRPVVGERGRWLAGLRPDWRWVLDDEPAPAARAPLSPDDWRALPAAARADALPADDPDLLEAALDDRSDKVRRRALALLDAAPGSARAARMAERLRALLAPTGRLRRGLEVALPTEPDAAGVRDGLTRTRGGSQRERWLELISAGAPLSVWTDATGKDAAHTWPLITQPAARAGVLRAIRARGDVAWATAAAADSPDLLAYLPAAEQDAAALRLLRTTKAAAGVAAVVRHVAAPWSPALSAAVVDILRHTAPAAGSAALALPTLAAGLHPSVRPAVSAWARTESRWGSLPADLDQYLSFLPAITEAFR
ncbi:DUF5691 domain-containing protein [Nocardioides kongjuensis]|uniref:Uncharacterized protein n=1 Tax=Nocardioides kongjuensis TaxID=349522 RepID=A0A852RUY9_9ACTN|nr:hypothetical protein [Nocardioides kongjuensis]